MDDPLPATRPIRRDSTPIDALSAGMLNDAERVTCVAPAVSVLMRAEAADQAPTAGLPTG
ncbi:hypothetical protein [Nonomuraea roseola]|uniref:hypothetical protein n=1 Tax=Nonomuraea roseola TaxID=46179 RepID=UPI0031F7FDC3